MDHSSFTKPADNLLSKTLYIPPLIFIFTDYTVSALYFVYISLRSKNVR